jgi:hypothetical protein
MEKNPQFGMPIEPVEVPPREHFDIIRQYESTQIVRSYEYWAEDIVKRETARREATAKCVNLIHKLAIVTEEDITRTEQLETFIQWLGPKS